LRSERAGGIKNPAVVGGDDQFVNVARLAGPFVDVLKHGLSGDEGESFSRET
jgi:hypothetical protein